MPEGHLYTLTQKKYNFFISNIWESGPGLNVLSVPTSTQQTLLYHGAGTGLHHSKLETCLLIATHLWSQRQGCTRSPLERLSL